MHLLSIKKILMALLFLSELSQKDETLHIIIKPR